MNKNKLDKTTMWSMISVAMFIDATQAGVNIMDAIPFVGIFLSWALNSGIDIFAWLTFFLWFNLKGVKYNTRIATTTVGAFFIGLIPILNALPEWTLSIVLILLYLQTKEIASKVAPEVGKLVGGKIDEEDKNPIQFVKPSINSDIQRKVA